VGDESQVSIPEAFIALYLEPGRSKPSAPHQVIALRHEICEDLATALADRARLALWQQRSTEQDVLQQLYAALDTADSGLEPSEAVWVTRRLAELLAWPQPALPTRDPS
jgi:hypothetical protein